LDRKSIDYFAIRKGIGTSHGLENSAHEQSIGLVALIMGDASGSISIVLEKVGLALPESSVPGATIVLPVVYGIGTALPVSLVAILLVVSAKSIGKTYNILAKVEWWARNITGGIFLVLGLYFSLKYVFGVSL